MAVITDDRLIVVLAGFESRVDRVLQQIREENLPAPAPQTSPDRSVALRVVGRLGHQVSVRAVAPVAHLLRGDSYPGQPGWLEQPPPRRAQWWVSRIATWAAGPAALPWVAGKLSDRLPLKDGLSAVAQGLVVCAVSREYGVEDAERRISLLAEVLTGRRIEPAAVAAVRASHVLAEAEHDELPAEFDRDVDDHVAAPHRGVVRRAGQSLWTLARGIREVQGLLDNRQQGHLLARGVGMLPGVGVIGGYFAERSALSRTGRRTEQLLDRRFGIRTARR